MQVTLPLLGLPSHMFNSYNNIYHTGILIGLNDGNIYVKYLVQDLAKLKLPCQY